MEQEAEVARKHLPDHQSSSRMSDTCRDICVVQNNSWQLTECRCAICEMSVQQCINYWGSSWCRSWCHAKRHTVDTTHTMLTLEIKPWVVVFKGQWCRDVHIILTATSAEQMLENPTAVIMTHEHFAADNLSFEHFALSSELCIWQMM